MINLELFKKDVAVKNEYITDLQQYNSLLTKQHKF